MERSVVGNEVESPLPARDQYCHTVMGSIGVTV